MAPLLVGKLGQASLQLNRIFCSVHRHGTTKTMGIIKATTHLARILVASKGATQTQATIPLPRTKQTFHKAWSQVRNRSVRRPDVKSLRQRLED